MTAIITTYVPCTNTKPSRIKADAGDGRKVFVSYDNEGSNEKAHFRAVQTLCRKFDWHGVMVPGGTDKGYAWTFLPRECRSEEIEKAIANGDLFDIDKKV